MWSEGQQNSSPCAEEEGWFAVVPSQAQPLARLPRSATAPHIIPFGPTFPFPQPNGLSPSRVRPQGGLPRHVPLAIHSHPGTSPPAFVFERSEFNPAEFFPEHFVAGRRSQSRPSSSASSSTGLGSAGRAGGGRSSSASRGEGDSSDAEPGGLILGVSLHPSLQPTQSPTATCLFKCLRLSNGERLADIIAKALEKHLLEAMDPKDFCLVQLKEDGSEFVLPDGCNPFYAIVGGKDGQRVQMELRRKGIANTIQAKAGSGQMNKSLSSTVGFKTRKKKRSDQGSNLFRWNSGFL